MEIEKHYTNRSGWLRAAVLGANDGILSTTSLAIGVAAASDARYPIILASLAGLVAGALSMAAGEYVSVSSQYDIEVSDLDREKKELDSIPEIELEELSNIYVERGLDKDLARQVAAQLTQRNSLEAHARDELGINQSIFNAKAFTSCFRFRCRIYSGRSFAIVGLHFCFFEIYGFLPIRICHHFSGFIRCSCCESWRLKYF